MKCKANHSQISTSLNFQIIKKMKKPNWKNIGIIVVVLGLLGYISFAIVKFSHKDDENICEKVVITVKDSANLQFVSVKDIRNTLDESELKLVGLKFRKIKTRKVETILEKNPFIKNVECYKTPSGDLNIDVWQREPLFRVYGLSRYYIDIDGKFLPISEHFVAYVPVVTGTVNKLFAITKLKDFVLYLRKNEFWNAQIEQIDVDANNEIVLIPRVGDHEIELGTLDDYQQKLAKLKTFYLRGLNKIGWGDYKSISLKYKNQVVCTKK